MIINDINQLYDIVDRESFNIILEQHVKSVDVIEPAITWQDLDFDELDFIEMIMSIETNFDIAIDDELSGTIEAMTFKEFYNKIGRQKLRNDKLEQLGI